MRRRRVLVQAVAVVAVMLVAAGCGKFGTTYKGSSSSTTSSTQSKRITDKPFDAAAQKAAGCTPFESLKSEGRGHVQDPKQTIPYTENPPASGKHYQVPLDWGVYSAAQPDEHWVHNLEHGHIVILYKKITASDKSQLLGYVKKDPYHLVVMPREKNPKDGIYYVAWTKRLYCAKPSAEALQYMIDNTRDQGPELFANDPKKA